MADKAPTKQNQPGQASPGALASGSGETHEGTQPAPQHEGGLPQLNHKDWAPQLVWLAITFGALYWIMSRYALPRIADVIERRRDRIASDIDTAKKYQQQSEEAEAAYKSALAEAKSKAHTIAQDKRDKLNAKTDAKRADVDKKIAAKLLESEQKISASKTAALKEVNIIAGSTTKEIIAHLIGNKVSDKDLSKAIKEIASR